MKKVAGKSDWLVLQLPDTTADGDSWTFQKDRVQRECPSKFNRFTHDDEDAGVTIAELREKYSPLVMYVYRKVQK